MKKFLLIPNKKKEEARNMIPEILKISGSLGAEIRICDRNPADHTSVREVPEDTEAVITLGGDGTILQAARDLRTLSLPILGINAGHLGYLTEVGCRDTERALRALVQEDFTIEERMMLHGEILREGRVILRDDGLNDVVLHQGESFRAIYFDMMVNGIKLMRYHADGMILATPTGSTAYNLSAGGPIVLPGAKLIVATPVNPHTLLRRSVVLPENAEIVLQMASPEEDNASVNFDGAEVRDFRYGDELHVVRSEYSAKLIKLSENSFIESLRTKLEN